MSDDIRLSDIVLLNRLSQSYSVSLALWEHTVLPVTRHKWTHLAVTPARQDGTRSTYPGGMEGWVDLGEWLYTEMTTGGMWLPSTDHIRVPPVLQSTLGSSLSPVWSPPSCSTSNEPIPGLLGMCISTFSLDDLFYVFLRLVSISLRSWNGDDREDVGCGLPDEIYALLLCLVVVWIQPFLTSSLVMWSR